MPDAGTIPHERDFSPAPDLTYQWSDEHWMERRGERLSATAPVSIYEAHLGSWMRVPEENNRMLTYPELAPKLADYARCMHYTHVLMLDAREGPELKALIDYLHQQEIGVVLNWNAAAREDARPTSEGWTEEYHVDGLCGGEDLIGPEGGPEYKLDLGFAHDVRSYLAHPPAERKLHHKRLTFRRMYAFQENYILPLSHREAAPLLHMPGDEWQKFANFRLLLAYMFLQPGKKLLFMGHDFGQWREWNADMSIDWHLTHLHYHQGTQKLVRRLNDVYYHERALHEGDSKAECFEWIDCHDAEGSTISWLRWDADFHEVFLAVFNFTPKVYRNFKIGVPRAGEWREVINTDAREYGGSGQGNFGAVKAAPFGCHGRPYSLFITVPPLAAVAFKSQEGK
jgi:1,4-alpha-glucan branching enzyme